MNARSDGTIIILDTVDSTNNYAMGIIDEGLAEHGLTVMAIEQTQGKGQQGKTWISQRGENIICSIIVSSDHLNIHLRFKFAALVALTCAAFIKRVLTNTSSIKIKWPNDIFIGDRKAGGILIENKILGSSWRWAVVGIGINVNQIAFPLDLMQKATSLKTETGRHYDLEELVKDLSGEIIAAISRLSSASFEEVMRAYNKLLYKKDEVVKLKKENRIFETMIKSVDSSGNLVTSDVFERTFTVNEVSWVL